MTIDTAEEAKIIKNKYRLLLRAAKRARSDHDKKRIRKAFDLALKAHEPMRRKSGEPYIYHPIAVAQIVAEEIGLGTTSIVCALLHDTVEDTYVTLDDIEQQFGPRERAIIDGLTKISGVIDHNDPNYSIQAENFRKMMLTLSDDVRVILVKLADRLHNMRTMEFMPRHKQIKIAYETLFIYAPLAHRLGLNAIKTELENLAFSYTEPELYKEIHQKIKDTEQRLTRYINRFSLPIINELTDKGYAFDIKGRPKSIYSIARKMKQKAVPFEEVYDIFAIRIIIDSKPKNEKADCWGVYSVVTDLYKPRPDRLRDWISTPKANGYESLHTTVMGPDGRWVEVQIRTSRMDEIAEKGLAAHWKYKTDADGADNKLEEWISKVRMMLENPDTSTLDFIDDVKLNLFSDEIFVFTPKGELKTLPNNSTALDFAYEIHSNIGDHCIGAKVNHKLVPLSYVLQTGEQVEVLTSNKQMPKEEWLNLVHTAKAKHAIKHSIKRVRKEISEKGKIKYKRILEALEVKPTKQLLADLVSYFELQNSTDLYYRIALKKIDRYNVKDFLEQRANPSSSIVEESKIVTTDFGKGDVLIIGEEKKSVDYTLSKCCNPIPGDEVFGFITPQGIMIHKTNCANAMHLQANFAFRSIKTKWSNNASKQFLTGVKFKGTDDVGLLNKILNLISTQEQINIKSVGFDSDAGVFEGKIMLYVQDRKQLDDLRNKLRNIEGVHDIERIDTN
jgi:GTP pyrophosphokinase